VPGSVGVCAPDGPTRRFLFFQSEPEYPQFTVDWMAKLWDKLTDDGSALIVIDPHVKDGVMSDYVRRTEDALCGFGWKQHQTQIWYKRDRGPLGHKEWPRHCWEHVLWFSKTARPFCDAKAGGRLTDHLTMNDYTHSKWTNGGKPGKKGIARTTDVIDVPIGGTEKGIDHPAMCPVELAEQLIATFCPAGGTVVDPFAGSGTTLVAAKKLGCGYYGFDVVTDYCEIARKRLTATIRGGSISEAG
jgi:DNA modification methylase